MKILKFIPLLLLGSLLFMNMDCGRDDKCDHITKAPQEFLDYFYFPEGSWWVYKNQDGELDTVTCYYEKSKYYTPDDAYELIPCLYYYDCFYSHSNKVLFPESSNENYHHIWGLSNNDGVFWNLLASNTRLYCFSYFFKYPFSICDTIDYNVISGKKRLTTIVDTNIVVIDTNIYHNTVHINYVHEGTKPDQLYSDVWLSKWVGIVKINYYNGQYWELIDYKINN